jgi:hypothetical protein
MTSGFRPVANGNMRELPSAGCMRRRCRLLSGWDSDGRLSERKSPRLGGV